MKRFPLLLLLAVFAFGCGQSYNENKDNGIARSADTTSVSGSSGDPVKLVKTAALHFKVRDVEKSTRAVSDMARQLGGMVYNEGFENAEGGRQELKLSADSLLVITTSTPQAEITARIPSQHLEEFLYGVADLGYFTGSSTIHIDDKSLEYMENVLKQKNRKEVLSQPAAPKKAPTSLETIAVKDEIAEQQIQNKGIDADVQYSTVNLSLFQNATVRREVIANYAISDYQLPFGTRLAQALANGWSAFLAVVVVLANLWMFVVLAIAVYLCYRLLVGKRKVAV